MKEKAAVAAGILVIVILVIIGAVKIARIFPDKPNREAENRPEKFEKDMFPSGLNDRKNDYSLPDNDDIAIGCTVSEFKEKNSSVSATNDTTGEVLTGNVNIADMLFEAELHFDQQGSMDSAFYTTEYTDGAWECLIRYLAQKYGYAAADTEDGSTYRWLIRIAGGETFEMKSCLQDSSIILSLTKQTDTSGVWNYVIPDMNNTGYYSPAEQLQEFTEKYPECIGSDGRILITEKSAEKYNYCFEQFRTSENIRFTNLNTPVLLDDFYLSDGNIINDYRNNGGNTVITLRNGEVENGMIRACNMVIDKIYMHDSESDFINALYNVKIYDSYFTDGGTNPEAHADGIQIAGYDSIDAYDIYLENVRIDMPHIPGYHVANACVMIQPDYGAVNGTELNRCILNGGGFTIYSFPKKNTIANVVMQNTIIGDGYRFGVYYKNSQQNMSEINTARSMEPLIGSIYVEDNQFVFNLSNYNTKAKSVNGTIRYLKNGEESGEQEFSADIGGYIPFSDYGEKLDYGGKVVDYPRQPVNLTERIDMEEPGCDAVSVTFYSDGNYLGSYYIAKQGEME
ncbi:hypothetical protein [Robinsoniella peoriensis]|uniref:hypothetical protein n=1 Tax=Robinsoniella peoriensis TaxID=180332 RepID=UPI0037524035